MVLELKVPHGTALPALRPLIPVFLSYVLSFVFLGIYWNNHHHLLQAVRQVTGAVLWANLHLLFWLSLTPFVTSWMGDSGFAAWPVALYGVALLACALAFLLLVQAPLAVNGRTSTLATALGRERTVIPQLFTGKGAKDYVRVWSVGCATGEEAYSLAILLLEAAAQHEREHGSVPRLQLFATDLHKRSLERGCDGFYPG